MHYKGALSRRIFMTGNVIFFFLLALTCFLPMINVLAISFSSSSAAQAGFVSFWPVHFNVASYKYALGRPQFLTSMWVSLKRITLGGLINMLLTILAAYPLSKDNSKLRTRTAYSWFFVTTMLISGGLIPTFMVIDRLGLLDTLWALILPGALPVFNLIILLNFFRHIPVELEEAAAMDGASHWTILWRIYVPCSTPAIATLTLFVLVNHWNSWFDGLLYMNHTTHYLPLELTGEPGLSSGAALAHLVDKYCGTISVGPFGCMNSRMTEAVATVEMTPAVSTRLRHPLFVSDTMSSPVLLTTRPVG